MMKTLALALLLTLPLFAQKDANVSVDMRATYINYTYDTGFKNAEAFATTLKLLYTKELAYGFSAGIAFATLQDFGILNDNPDKRALSYMFSKEQKGFTLLEQAFLKYNYSKSFERNCQNISYTQGSDRIY